jgi:hypothetical protein
MRQTAQLLAGIVLLAGCSGEPIPSETTAHIQPQAAASRVSEQDEDEDRDWGRDEDRDRRSEAAVKRDLAALRRVTAPFHNFAKAKAAGWSAQITECLTDPAGGMGYHYGKTALFDASVRVKEPELLLYEPERNGRLRLVAVEYIIPYSFHSRAAAPPVLFGKQFFQNDVFQLWGLHAWVWKHNPSGVFANWNPRVTCKYATSASTMGH